MSATDELRRLLDERGVHWWEGEDERKTLWESNGLTWEYFNNENDDAWLGFLGACEQDITPEQAIAATLGGGDSSRYAKLFGTPERAARTIMRMCDGMERCDYCPCFDQGGICPDTDDCDALLEWLRGDAE